ncbi:MAG: hypothetical protein ABH877_05875, partial [bacterium]
MPRLTDFLRGYAPFEEALRRGGAAPEAPAATEVVTLGAPAAAPAGAAPLELAAPRFIHAYLTA